jgi:hypothetical protein
VSLVLLIHQGNLLREAHAQVPQNVINAPTTVPFPQGVQAINIDGDAMLDVAVISRGNGTLAWFAGQSPGTYGDRSIITDELAEPTRLFSGQVDGAGGPDLIVVDGPSTTEIYWYPNDGTGSFGNKQLLDDPGLFYDEATLVDVEPDGDPDLVVTYDDQIILYQNDGTGRFTKRNIPFNGALLVNKGLVAADLDGDGDVDLATLSFGNGSIPPRLAWHENDGTESFTQQDITTDLNWPASLTAGDVTGDGRLDLVYGAEDASTGDEFLAYHANFRYEPDRR